MTELGRAECLASMLAHQALTWHPNHASAGAVPLPLPAAGEPLVEGLPSGMPLRPAPHGI